MEFLTIGKLARIAQVSPDTLRYYDSIGLLKPAHIDNDSGYRYYTPKSAEIMVRIAELKEYGFSLKEIKIALEKSSEDLNNSDDFYKRRYTELLQQRHRLDYIIEKLAAKIGDTDKKEGGIIMKRILLIDDAPIMRMMQKDIFSKSGYEVVGEGENGLEGVELYKNLRPDIVIVNYVMPEMDGITAISKIREINPDAKIVMVSAMAKPAVIIDALLAGASRFVLKPFESETLLEKLVEALANDSDLDFEVLAELKTNFINNDKDDILSQNGVDEIINVAKSGVFAEFEPEKLGNINSSLPEALDIAKLIPILQNVIKGQEEIKALLKKR